MKPFAGFPPGKTRFTPIPDQFFSELLVAIDDLAELQLTLYMFWALNRQKGYPRYLTMPELEHETLLLAALRAGGATDPLAALRAAVDKAVARGTLLRLSIANEQEQVDYLFANTPQGRKAVEQVKRGELLLEITGHVRDVYVPPERASILELYEQNIGLLQPLLVEELLEAEQTYPREWIEEAFRLAVENNVRRWRYIRAILERWGREGKDDGKIPRRAARETGLRRGPRR